MKKITVYARPSLHARLTARAKRNGRSLAAQCLIDIEAQVGFEDHQASTERAPIFQKPTLAREGVTR